MKIAFVRMGLPTELRCHMASAATLGTEIREALFADWQQRGHRVSIYTPVKKKDLPYLGAMRYDPVGLPKDADALFIEMGVGNELYKYSILGRKRTYIDRMLECVQAHRGLVVYYQHGCLALPVNRYARRADLFDGKRWRVVHHFTNEREFERRFYANTLFANGGAELRFMPLGYGPADPWFPVKAAPTYDALFIGSQWDSASRSTGFGRVGEITEYYDTPLYKGAIIGKWEPAVTREFEHARYLGHIGTHGDAYTFWNDALCCVWTTSAAVRQLGLLPTRPIMALRAGCLLLADHRLHGIERYVSREFVVRGADDVAAALDAHRARTVAQREALRRRQLKRWPQWAELDFFGGTT